jgi:hypothetical protein
MDIRKIIRKVLLEQGQPQTENPKTDESQYYMNWRGVYDIPKTYGGKPVIVGRTIKTIPNVNDYNIGWFEDACKKYLELPNNKYPNLESCIIAQKQALLGQMEIGGVTDFEWNGQRYSACVRRNNTKQYSEFSGYYGSHQGSSCYAPEFYWDIKEKKISKDNKKSSPGFTKSTSLTVTGPDFK